MSAATFGTDATHVGRELQTAVVTSRTSSPAPLTGISTATAAGTAGTGDVGAGVGASVGVVVGAVEAVTVGEGEPACGVHATRTIVTIAGANSLFIQQPSENGGILPP